MMCFIRPSVMGREVCFFVCVSVLRLLCLKVTDNYKPTTTTTKKRGCGRPEIDCEKGVIESKMLRFIVSSPLLINL